LLWWTIGYGGLAAVLWYWRHPIAQYVTVSEALVQYVAVAVICVGTLRFIRTAVRRIRVSAWRVRGGADQDLVDVARGHLSRVRFLQNYTRGWSGTLSL